MEEANTPPPPTPTTTPTPPTASTPAPGAGNSYTIGPQPTIEPLDLYICATPVPGTSCDEVQLAKYPTERLGLDWSQVDGGEIWTDLFGLFGDSIKAAGPVGMGLYIVSEVVEAGEMAEDLQSTAQGDYETGVMLQLDFMSELGSDFGKLTPVGAALNIASLIQNLSKVNMIRRYDYTIGPYYRP
jgi:hypothetical protein